MISVVTPAHNEERFIEKCLASVRRAARQVDEPVEHIVVLNRCTDRTELLARQYGARVVREDARNLSQIRNAGAAEAQGQILVTVDADSWMSDNMLAAVRHRIDTGRYVGGGVQMYPERLSLGIVCSVAVILPYLLWNGSAPGCFGAARPISMRSVDSTND